MIQDYTKTGNLEELLKILENIFPQKEGLFHLLIGTFFHIIMRAY